MANAARTRSHSIPVSGIEMADYAQLRTMRRQHIGAETGFRPESGRSPVQKNVICCSRGIRQLHGENTDQDVWAFGEVRCARDNDGRPDFSLASTGQNANDHIPRPQPWPPDSSASSLRSEAALKSFRSSSDQESDQSIFRFGASSASRSVNADSSEAVSGGRRRNASTNNVSRSFSRMSMSLHSVYGLCRTALLASYAVFVAALAAS